MAQATRKLLEHALKLPPAERAELVAQLVASLDGDEPEGRVERAWADEIERRVREMPAPGAALPSADEVFSRLRTHLAERRRAK
ncbi:MAG: addiction module protein [Planctomycetes bacterium]|nr:addiction module protein [Planctomycetota bacterium]